MKENTQEKLASEGEQSQYDEKLLAQAESILNTVTSTEPGSNPEKIKGLLSELSSLYEQVGALPETWHVGQKVKIKEGVEEELSPYVNDIAREKKEFAIVELKPDGTAYIDAPGGAIGFTKNELEKWFKPIRDEKERELEFEDILGEKVVVNYQVNEVIGKVTVRVGDKVKLKGGIKTAFPQTAKAKEMQIAGFLSGYVVIQLDKGKVSKVPREDFEEYYELTKERQMEFEKTNGEKIRVADDTERWGFIVGQKIKFRSLPRDYFGETMENASELIVVGFRNDYDKVVVQLDGDKVEEIYVSELQRNIE